MNTIVIRPKSKSNYDFILSLLKKLDEEINIIDDKTLSDALFVAEIEESDMEGWLSKKEKSAFIIDLNSAQ